MSYEIGTGCWSRALMRYLSSIKSGRDAESFRDLLQGSENYKPHDLVDHNQKMFSGNRKEVSGNHKHLAIVAKKINKVSPVVDVMIQSQPQVVSLVWGSMRFIFQIVTKNSAILNNLEAALQNSIPSIALCEALARDFATDAQLLNAIENYYVAILDFCAQTNIYFSKSYSRHLLNPVTSSFRSKLKKKIAEVERRERFVDQEWRAVLTITKRQRDVNPGEGDLKDDNSVHLGISATREPLPNTSHVEEHELSVLHRVKYISKSTQTPLPNNPSVSGPSSGEHLQTEEARRRIEAQTQILRQLLSQQWETAEEQRKYYVSRSFQKIIALVVTFISIASLVAALWIGKIQIDLARPPG